MNDLELGWLIPTMLEVSGLAIALGVMGFAYDHMMRGRKPLITVLEEGHWARWLAVAGVVFATGIGFTQANWWSKGIAIALALLLIGLAWKTPRGAMSFREKVDRQGKRKISIGKRVVTIIIGVISVMAMVWVIFLGWHTAHLYNLAQNLKNDTSTIQLDSLLPLFKDAAGDIRAIHGGLEPLFPIFNALRGMPGVGASLGQIEPLLTYADALAQAGNEISLGVGPLLEKAPVGEENLTLPERASLAFVTGQSHFLSAAQEVDQASRARTQIRPELLPDSVQPIYLKLDAKFDLLAAGIELLKVAPKILGTNEPQSYLVLAQNRDELRATGGFISGVGLVTIQKGKIQQLTLGDSYQVDDYSSAYPEPPEPLNRFMLADYWVTRDANWSPDFPTTAQQAQSLYTLSTGIETDGVIAFNQLAIRNLLKVIGSVQVPGTKEPITAENVEEYMREAWAPAPGEGISEEWWLHRKDFMQLLGGVILENMLDSDNQGQLLTLAMTLADLLDQGQLLVYFIEPSTQKALDRGRWDHGLSPGTNDYLYWVDSNVGFNKVDSVIQRSLTYRVDLSDLSHPNGEVTMSYQHTLGGDNACKQEVSYGNGTYKDMQQRCYLDYWRVYAPGGADLLSSTAQPVPADELLNGQGWPGQVESLPGEADSQVFAGLLMVPMAETSQITLSYSLPTSVIHTIDAQIKEYVLRLQVQPGLDGLPFRLEVTLPDKVSPVNPANGWDSTAEKMWIWQGVLNQFTELRLSIQVNP